MTTPSYRRCFICKSSIIGEEHVWQRRYYCTDCFERLYGECDRNAKEKGLYSAFGWNADNMFFLTRDGDVEITEVGFPPEKFPDVKGLFYYGNQVLQNHGTKSDDPEFDIFGRNRIDRQFIHLCLSVFGLTMDIEDAFISLSCKKVDDKYAVRLQLTDETLEAELPEMIQLVEERWLNE